MVSPDKVARLNVTSEFRVWARMDLTDGRPVGCVPVAVHAVSQTPSVCLVRRQGAGLAVAQDAIPTDLSFEYVGPGECRAEVSIPGLGAAPGFYTIPFPPERSWWQTHSSDHTPHGNPFHH